MEIIRDSARARIQEEKKSFKREISFGEDLIFIFSIRWCL